MQLGHIIYLNSFKQLIYLHLYTFPNEKSAKGKGIFKLQKEQRILLKLPHFIIWAFKGIFFFLNI